MTILKRLFGQRRISPEREALIDRYVELTGLPTQQQSHGVAVRAKLRDLNPLRADEAESIGVIWQGGIDSAEAEYARPGASYTATGYLTDDELRDVVGFYEKHDYLEVIAIARSLKASETVSAEAQEIYRYLDDSTWAKKVVAAFQAFTSDRKNSQFLKDAIDACSEVMERSLADKKLVSAFRGNVQ